MAKEQKPKFVRRQITIPEDFDDRVKAMAEDYGCASFSEFFRFAVNKLAEKGHPAFPTSGSGGGTEA